MKRVILLVFTALAALMAASCQKEEMGRILTATIEQYEHNSKDGNGASKAYINDQYYACWENNDKVKINGTEYTVSISAGDEHNYHATIQGDVPTGQNLLAYYPASQVTDWNGNNVSITLPQVQEYRENNGHQVIDNPMAAYCPEGSKELKFRNLCALLKVTIQAPSNEDLNLKAIVVKGDDGQMLWGTTQLTLDNQNKPMLEKMSYGGASVSLSFPSTVTIIADSSKSFYIVVPAGSDFFNFSISVATDQGSYLKVSKINQSLPRNHIGALTYAPTEEEKFLPIFYTGSIQDFDRAAFGDAQVLSSDGGVILFDRPLSTIEENAFYGGSGLTSITLPAGLTTIGDYAFYGCSGLTSITLPASLTTIGMGTFYGCFSLTNISLPAGVTSIGEGAFAVCSSLTTVYVNRWNGDSQDITQGGYGMFDNCPLTKGIYVPTGAVLTYKGSLYWRDYGTKIK